jgi:uncharacterized protein
MNPVLHLDGFRGVARLFPLPNFVMMPHVLKGFHIFEPRYRELVEDALKEDKLIGLVLPKEGWDKNYEGSFGVHTFGCLTQIHEHERLDDGRFNLVLRGLCRMELEHELLSSTLYRQAKVKLLPDPPAGDEGSWRAKLEEEVLPWLAIDGEGREQFQKLMHSAAPLGTIIDVVSFALPIPPDWKQTLLEHLDVKARAQKLCELLHSVQPFQSREEFPPSARRQPPDFSNN